MKKVYILTEWSFYEDEDTEIIGVFKRLKDAEAEKDKLELIGASKDHRLSIDDYELL